MHVIAFVNCKILGLLLSKELNLRIMAFNAFGDIELLIAAESQLVFKIGRFSDCCVELHLCLIAHTLRVRARARVYVCVCLTFISTYFQSYHDGDCMCQRDICSFYSATSLKYHSPDTLT